MMLGNRPLRFATLALSLLILVAGCAEGARRPTSNPDLELRFADIYVYRGATAPVSMRIYLSDVVVWARLTGSNSSGLLFEAVEYLKGSGSSEFVVTPNPWYRGKGPWDDRDAVLFLSLPEGQPTSDSGARLEYTFTDTVQPLYNASPSQSLPAGFRFETRNPVWLPAVEPPAAADTQNPDPRFFIEEVSPAGIELPRISLSELRSMVEWQENPGGVAGYNDCVLASAQHEQSVRNSERYSGVALEVLEARSPLEKEIPSGAPEGMIIVDYVVDDDGYTKVWIEEGPLAHLFRAFIFDDDENPANGYADVEATTRPLPTGVYTFKTRNQSYRYQPCNFDPIGNGAYVQVTVLAPPGTRHEAFFDPVVLPDGSVGASAILKPSRPAAGPGGTEIVSLTWSGGQVALVGNDILSLGAYTLDFFELDGSISLSLDMDSAEWVNEVDSSYTWYVRDPPWHPGDKLMLRIRQTDVGPTIVSEQHDLTAQLQKYRIRLESIREEYALYNLGSDLERTQQEVTIDDGDDGLSQEEASGLWYAFAIVLLLSVGIAGAIVLRR